MNRQFPGSSPLVSEFQGRFQVTDRRQVSEVGSAVCVQASSKMTLLQQIKSVSETVHLRALLPLVAVEPVAS